MADPISQEDRDYDLAKKKLRNEYAKTILENATKITAVITVVTGLVTAFNTVYKTNRDFEISKYTHNRENYKTELTFVDSHLDTAVLEDVGIRLRFAEYFKSVAPTAEQREGWENYYLLVKEEYDSKPPERDSL